MSTSFPGHFDLKRPSFPTLAALAALILVGLISLESARAETVVASILSSKTLLIRSSDAILSPGERLPIFSKDTGQVAGYAIVEDVQPTGPQSCQATARIVTHSENTLIVPGDTLERTDFSKKDEHLPGRADLLFKGQGESAKYKPVVYEGISLSQTAATLGKNENLISAWGFYSYGLTDRVSLSTLGIADVIGIPNVAAKAQVIKLEPVTLSEELQFLTFPRESVSTWGVNSYFDVQSNSKLVSHTQLSILLASVPSANSHETQLGFSSSIASGYEYILDSWDRIFLGPKYDFAQKAIGGYLSYMMIWDHLHVGIGMQTVSFLKLTFNSQTGYNPMLDVYWRF